MKRQFALLYLRFALWWLELNLLQKMALGALHFIAVIAVIARIRKTIKSSAPSLLSVALVN